MTNQELMQILSEIKDPANGESLAPRIEIQDINLDGKFPKVRLHVSNLIAEEKNILRKLIESALEEKGLEALVSIVGDMPQKTPAQTAVKKLIPDEVLNRFQKRVAVYSTKGGVGKSTTAVALAIELANKGYKIAMLDLDIYGPSVPRIMGLREKITIHNEKFVPAERDGIHMMSVGLLIDSVDSPLVWRAPVVTGVLSQMLNETLWDNSYDYLIVDMPPGTGDIPITVGQSLGLHGIVGVTTPQGVALEDTLKGLSMFKKFDVPLWGMVYNMGSVICPDCQKIVPLYPHNTEYDELLMDYGLNITAELPMDPKVIAAADRGAWEELDDSSLWKKEFAKIVALVEEHK